MQGGKVICDWPGLAPNQLYEGSDLTPTTDLRAVFKGVLRDHLGVPVTMLNSTVFPSSTGILPMSNLVKPSTSLNRIRTRAVASSPTAPIEAPIAQYRRARAAARVAAN